VEYDAVTCQMNGPVKHTSPSLLGWNGLIDGYEILDPAVQPPTLSPQRVGPDLRARS
jgi:hypothetical protein